MKVFLAGATGAIGSQLVPLLLADGHEVIGSTRSRERAQELQAAGATPVVLDALDEGAVNEAMQETRPQVVIHQLTALPQRIDPRKIERDFVLNDRLRSEGTSILVAAARGAGAMRIIAQSIAFMYAPGSPGTLHAEQDPLLGNDEAPASFRRSAAAVRDLESTVLSAGGLVLRYGYFYGPGSAISGAGSMGQEIRRRRLPIVGSGAGVWSFIHIADAARATLAALTQGASAAYNVVDDDPAPAREWIPALARALAAPKPFKVPAAIARLAAGSYGVAAMTKAQGASNALAKRELDWTPAYASWREGFVTALG